MTHVLLGAQIAFGLLNAGKGALCMKTTTNVQLGAVLAAVFFITPSSEVQTRDKCQPINFLFSLALQEKLAAAVTTEEFDSETSEQEKPVRKIGKEVEVEIRSGRAVEDVLSDFPYRLAGFSLSRTPAVVGADDMALCASSKWEAAWRWTKGLVTGPGRFVVTESAAAKIQNVQANELKKDGIYE